MFLESPKAFSVSLRLILHEYGSSFVELFPENNDITNHHRNIQILLTEVFKTIKNLDPPIIEGMFNARPSNYNSRNFQELVTEEKEQSKADLRLIFRVPQLWLLLLEEIKPISSLDSFKNVIKNRTCDNGSVGSVTHTSKMLVL